MKFKFQKFGFIFKQWKAAHHERQLLALLKKGDKEAYRQLSYNHFDEILQYILLRVKSPKTAKVLLSEVYLKLWQNRASINAKKSFVHTAKDTAQQIVFAYLRWVSRDKELQKEIFEHFERLEECKEEPLFEPQYQAAMQAVRNKFLQQELFYQHSTAQG